MRAAAVRADGNILAPQRVICAAVVAIVRGNSDDPTRADGEMHQSWIFSIQLRYSLCKALGDIIDGSPFLDHLDSGRSQAASSSRTTDGSNR